MTKKGQGAKKKKGRLKYIRFFSFTQKKKKIKSSTTHCSISQLNKYILTN